MRFLSWLLSELKIENVSIKPICTVDVPDEDVASLDMTSGNRQRLLTAAAIIQNSFEDSSSWNAYFLADADFDILENRSSEFEKVIFTDFSCIESYFVSPRVVGKAFSLIWGYNLDQKQYDSIVETVTSIFILRWAANRLSLPIRFLSPAKSLTFKSGCIGVNIGDYTTRVLATSGLTDMREVLEAEAAIVSSSLPFDYRHLINGHDLEDVFHAFAKKALSGGTAGVKQEIISRILASCCEFGEMEAFELSETIRSLYTP